jgi:EmrB/QacA subfamily drug resistance transporter
MTTGIRNANYKYLVAGAFLFGIFMDLLDLTVVNVALPTLGREFGVGPSTLSWVVTGYLLSLAVWIPAAGWIGDRFGTKKTFTFALVSFTVASALCGAAQTAEQLIAFRILQGFGGGMMVPVGTAMLFRAFPAHERARAAVVMTVPTVIAPALGPVLGGWLVDSVDWRWIFYINVPVGVLGAAFCLVFLKEQKEETAGAFDLPGFVLSGAGLALVLYSLSRGPEEGWTAAPVLITGLTGLVCFVLLVFVELRTAQPMLDLRLFQDRMFRATNIVFFAAGMSLMGVFFLLTLFMQGLLGYSAIETGLILLPGAITVTVFAPVAGKLYPIVGPRRLLAVALVLFAASSGAMLLIDIETSVWWLLATIVLRGIAMAFTFIPLQAATFSTISSADTGRASSLFNTNRQVSAAVGVALLATVLIQRTETHVAESMQAAGAAAGEAAAVHGALLGFHDAFLAVALIGLLGLVSTVLIRDEDAAASMQGDPMERMAMIEGGAAASGQGAEPAPAERR